MNIIDCIFDTFKETIFLKDDSNLKKQVEELKEIRAAMQKKSLTEVLHEKEEKDRNDEHYKVEN